MLHRGRILHLRRLRKKNIYEENLKDQREKRRERQKEEMDGRENER